MMLAAQLDSPDKDELAAVRLQQRIEAVSQDPALLASLPAGEVMRSFEILGLDLSGTRANVQSGQSVRSAAATRVNNPEVTRSVTRLLEKGTHAMHKMDDFQRNIALQAMTHLESEDMHQYIAHGLRSFEPDEFISDIDRSTSDASAREALTKRVLDVSLDFLLRLLPKISVPELSGSHNGVGFKVHDLEMSGVSFKKQDVHVSFPQLVPSDQPARPLQGDESTFLHVEVRNMSAQFHALRCKLKAKLFPEVSVVTNARGEDIVVKVYFARSAADAKLHIVRIRVCMKHLHIQLDQSRYASLFNPMMSHLKQRLQTWICGAMEVSLQKPFQQLCDGLNEVFVETESLLGFFGKSRPEFNSVCSDIVSL